MDKSMLGEREPRWPSFLALIAMGALYLALPQSLSFGPPWILLLVGICAGIAMWISSRFERLEITHRIGYGVLAVTTAFLMVSVGLLIHGLPRHTVGPVELLRSAAILWVTNIVLFASWYWRLDAGGPHIRDRRPGHSDGAFLFPQMALDATQKRDLGQVNWSPHFVDYLFLAFNTSAAFSVAETAPLSRWPKALMMIQASLSILVLSLLAARSVNIL